MKPDVERGAWVIAVYKVIADYNSDDPAFDAFEALIKAARVGELFSAIRSSGTVPGDKFEKFRKICRLKPAPAREVLQHAERLNLIEISWSNEPSKVADSVRFKEDTKEAVLSAVGRLFPLIGPSDTELAALDILSATLLFPRRVEDLKSEIATHGHPDEAASAALRLLEELGLLNRTIEREGGSALLFNPHAFESNAEDAFRALNALNPSERQSAMDAVSFIRENPGVPLSPTIDKKIVSTLVKVGIIDYSKITTSAHGRAAYFTTAPYIWDVFDRASGASVSSDMIDDSKLFLNSLRFGQFFSTPDRGKVIDPWWIVNALVRDGAIAVQKPVQAIGQDYPLALSRGIINVVESPRHPGRFSMELVKTDVAVAVREVLAQNRFLPKEREISQEELERAGQFISPGAVRADLKLNRVLREHHDEIVFGLRTLRRKRVYELLAKARGEVPSEAFRMILKTQLAKLRDCDLSYLEGLIEASQGTGAFDIAGLGVTLGDDKRLIIERALAMSA
jgi:DNA-binding transcriptional ArsR family regulator